MHSRQRPVLGEKRQQDVMASRDAFTIAADYLEANSEALVESWIDWVKGRVQTGTVAALPERALKNHVPPVLRSLADYLRNPVELARAELLGHLRLHGQIRRDQGYSLQEVLAEFDGLADLVTRGVSQALTRGAHSAPTEDVIGVLTRLATGLRSVSFIAVGTYGESDEERSRSLSAALEEFARAVAHELRNPLNTLMLGLQLMQETDLETEQAVAQLETMKASVRRAAALLDTIQTLAVAEGARKGARLVTLEEAVRRVVEEFSDDAKINGIEVSVAPELPDVRIEAMLVYVVLANVVGNAIKYRDPDKDESWVRISAEFIEEEHDSGFCEVTVEDNGLGVPAELVPRIFQRGFRAHPEHAQGTGLGLSIVQQAVNGRGGSVEMETEEGQGALVRVRMRCLQSSSSALSVERFSVHSLMGEKALGASNESSVPRLPDLPLSHDDREDD